MQNSSIPVQMMDGRLWERRARAQQRLMAKITKAHFWANTNALWQPARLPDLQLPLHLLPSPLQPHSQLLLLLQLPLRLLQGVPCCQSTFFSLCAA